MNKLKKMLTIIIVLCIVAGISFAFFKWQSNKENISIKPQVKHSVIDNTNATNQTPIKEERPNPDNLLNEGIVLYNQGNYKKAEQLFSEAWWEYFAQNDYLRNNTIKDSFLLPDDVIPVWRKAATAAIYTIFSEWQQLLKLQPATEEFVDLNNKLFLSINTFQDYAPISLEFNFIKALISVNAPTNYKPKPPIEIKNTPDYVFDWWFKQLENMPFRALDKKFFDSFKQNLATARNAYNNGNYQIASQALNEAFSNYASIVSAISYELGINVENILAGNTILMYTSFAYYNTGNINSALVSLPHSPYMSDEDRNAFAQIFTQMQQKTFKAPTKMPDLAPLILPSLP